jgi:DNA (cytosine-5)-methyltransferase 1
MASVLESDPFIGSLCTGYGGLGFAVEEVLGGFPDVPNLGDLRAAGFPCQDISNAGKRAGITGSRSSLRMAIVGTLRVLRPSLVFVENVAALRSRGLDVVQTDLAALGYDTDWLCRRASDVGAPHRRDRLFLLAARQSTKPVADTVRS